MDGRHKKKIARVVKLVVCWYHFALVLVLVLVLVLMVQTHCGFVVWMGGGR
jgi:hypothetical protein